MYQPRSFAKTFFIALVLTACFWGAPEARGADHTVTMKSISFDPKIIELKVGDSVEWQNRSLTEHSATADEKDGFDTGLIQPQRSSKKIDFKKAGTFSYHCSVHGKTMSGQVTVKP